MVCAYEDEQAREMEVDLNVNSFLEYCSDVEGIIMDLYEMRTNSTVDEASFTYLF
jgi:hypothetical protein